MNVIIIIQARMGSSRLLGKVLMTIQGKSILEHLIDFLRYSKLTNRIIVATTNLSEDDKIEELLRNIGIDCYRGSSEDVLKRYYDCAKFFKGDLIVRITADNPLVDPTLVDEVIRVAKETECDFATNMLNQTYPLGYLVEVFPFHILQRLHETQKDPLSREHVTYHIKKNPNLYDVKEVFAPPDIRRPEWRLAVDEIEDFQLMKEVFSKLYKPNHFIEYRSVVNLIDKNKNLVRINEKYPDSLNSNAK